jgi:hypothetical protein
MMERLVSASRRLAWWMRFSRRKAGHERPVISRKSWLKRRGFSPVWAAARSSDCGR